VRECETCRGTDDAFLSREFDNEKTILLGRWFHAVKLAPEVLEESHVFHELFTDRKPPHLFVATADGTLRVDLSGQQSQKELWRAMLKVLRKAYTKDADRAVTEMRKLLDELDRYDNLVAAAEERLINEAAAKGPDDASVKKLDEELQALRAEREEALERGAEIDDLGLREA
jgi:hypothetical protein